MDLEALQKDEQELENLQETLAQAQRRAQQLREIVALGEQAIEKDRDVCVNKGFILFAQYQLDASTQTQSPSLRETEAQSCRPAGGDGRGLFRDAAEAH